jgi:hypothetical protein
MMLKWQVGQFFVLLGFIVLIVFFISGQENNPIFLYFCSGVLLLGLGVYFMWTGRNPGVPSERFRFMRRFSERREKKRKKGGEKTEE